MRIKIPIADAVSFACADPTDFGSPCEVMSLKPEVIIFKSKIIPATPKMYGRDALIISLNFRPVLFMSIATGLATTGTLIPSKGEFILFYV